MVPLERWFGYLLILVLYLTVHQCIFVQLRTEPQNGSQTLPPNITCSDVLHKNKGNKSTEKVPSSSQNEANAPTLFPQEATNGRKILTCNNNVTVCLNTADTKINSTDVTSTKIQLDNLNNTNVNITEIKSNETSTQDATDAKLSSENTDKSTKLNETTINNNQTETESSGLNTTVTANSASSVNATKTDTEETPPTSLNKTVAANGTSSINYNISDTEVPDLLKPKRVHPTVTDLIPKIDFGGHYSYPRSNPSKTIDRETEYIDDGQNTEDTLRNSSAKEGDAPLPGVPLVQGQLAAILAGVFIAVSVIAYVGLLSWRRYLENRYGNRQMLINEDEFNDDLRHFSI